MTTAPVYSSPLQVDWYQLTARAPLFVTYYSFIRRYLWTGLLRIDLLNRQYNQGCVLPEPGATGFM